METKTYTVPAHCSNCDHDFDAALPFGQPVPQQIECPRCGCRAAERRRPTTKPVRGYPSWPRPGKFEPRCEAVRAVGAYHRPATWIPGDGFMRQAG